MRKALYAIPFLALFALLIFGCAASDPAGPHLAVVSIFHNSTYLVYTTRLDWSPDNTAVIFEAGGAGGGADVFRVPAVAGGVPVRMTQYDEVTWNNGGFRPCSLADGRVGYYNGWTFVPGGTDDHDMHIWAGAATMVNNVPAPVVLHEFNGSDLGFTPDSGATPEDFSLSGDGSIAAYSSLTDCWVLAWSGGATPSNVIQYAGCTEGAISRDGTMVAYVKGGNVCYRLVGDIDNPETVVGAGHTPSWATNGRLGYVAASTYNVHDTTTHTTATYDAEGITLQEAGISWDAAKVAYRTFGGADTGVSIATLVP
jgi:hypothetical protein